MNRTIRSIAAILCMVFLSCTKEAYYRFDVWETDTGMIRVSYCADVPEYTLLVACEEENVQDNGTPLYTMEGHEIGYGEYFFARACTPMYFRIISSVVDETKKI